MIFGGNIAVTCYAPISYISAVVMLLMQGVSDGSQPLISLAYGEGKHDTTKAVRDLAYRFAFGVAAICSVILFLLRGSAAYLFGASEPGGRCLWRRSCRSSLSVLSLSACPG